MTNQRKPTQRQVLQNLTSQSTGSDHQHLARISQELLCRITTLKGLIGEWPRCIKDTVDMGVLLVGGKLGVGVACVCAAVEFLLGHCRHERGEDD